jgi:hypothetical protein
MFYYKNPFSEGTQCSKFKVIANIERETWNQELGT